MPVFLLDDDDYSFPPPELAEEGGLLAVSQDLKPERLLVAYQSGLFPWFEEDGYFYWFTPDPRAVLFPSELKVHKSMRSIFNQNKFSYTFDKAFGRVIEACAQPRNDRNTTWITPDFIEAYTQLHKMGAAHSVEVWQGDELVGGLYGILLGRMFFGESMFTHVPNASKAGFITLVRTLERAGVELIDCQQETGHLVSLGARTIPRDEFMGYIKKLVLQADPQDE